MKPICIIPARAGSKRLPGKNIMGFDGRPMLSYAIDAAFESGLFDYVVVSTDSDEIAKFVISKTKAIFMPRPPHLATDSAEEIDVYRHVLKELNEQGDVGRITAFCAIYPTAVFLTADDIINSFGRMVVTGADACMGITTYPIHPFRALRHDSEGNLFQVFPDFNDTPSHAWPKMMASNGTLYWFRTESFLANPTYFPPKLVGYETFAVDIDTPADYQRALETHRQRRHQC